MSYETYGFFRKEFLNDKKGKLIESDERFLNIYDFWVLKHAYFLVPSKNYKIRKNFKKKVGKSRCKSKDFTNN